MDGGWRKYLLGEYVWIINNGGGEVWFLLMEEGVCNQNSADIDAEAILLKRLSFVWSE